MKILTYVFMLLMLSAGAYAYLYNGHGAPVTASITEEHAWYAKLHTNESILLRGVTWNDANSKTAPIRVCTGYSSFPIVSLNFSIGGSVATAPTPYEGSSNDTYDCFFATPMRVAANQSFYVGAGILNKSVQGTWDVNHLGLGSSPGNTSHPIYWYGSEPETAVTDLLIGNGAYYGPVGQIIFSVQYDRTLRQNTTQAPYTAVTNVSIPAYSGYTGGGAFLTWAVTCDMAGTSIFQEQFRTGYNFTRGNVSLNAYPPENYLRINSLEYTSANGSQFSLLKESIPYRDNLEVNLNFQINDGGTLSYMVFGKNEELVHYVDLERVNDTILYYAVYPGTGDRINRVNLTIDYLDSLDLYLRYTPKEDVVMGKHFDVSIVNKSGGVLGSDYTFNYGQLNDDHIKNINIFSDNFTDINIRRLGLKRFSSIQPDPVSWTQGRYTSCINETDCILAHDPSDTIVVSDDFYILPGYEGEFQTVCSYPAAGNYTQRHFLIEYGSGDYTDYKDVRVEVYSTWGQGGSGIVGEPQSDTGDVIIDAFNNLLRDAGVVSTTGKFILWMFILIVLSILIYRVTNSFITALSGIIILIAGFFLGFVPIWVILVLVLLSAGIGVWMYRNVMTG